MSDSAPAPAPIPTPAPPHDTNGGLKMNTVSGTLNTTSSRTFVITFTINDNDYTFTGTTMKNIRTSFENIVVGMKYNPAKRGDLMGPATFIGSIGANNLSFMLSSGVKIAERFEEFSPRLTFEGSGTWSMDF